MPHCPLCSDKLLRHIRNRQTYWFCQRCRFDILDFPDTDASKSTSYPHSIVSSEPINALQEATQDTGVTPSLQAQILPQPGVLN